MADLGVSGTWYQPVVPITGMTGSVYYTMSKRLTSLGVAGRYEFRVTLAAGSDSVYYTLRVIPAGSNLGTGVVRSRTEVSRGAPGVQSMTAVGSGVYLYNLAPPHSYLWKGSAWVSCDSASIWDGAYWVPFAEFEQFNGTAWVDA